MYSWLFGPPPQSLEEQLKTWKERLRKERVTLESTNRDLDRHEKEAIHEIKQYAKLGEIKAARILCGALVTLRHARERNLMIQVQLKSFEQQLSQQVAMANMSKAIHMSSEAMRALNILVKIPQIAATAKELGREMAKAGVMQDMMNDMFSDAEFEEEEKENTEADAEVDRVLEELTASVVLPSVPKTILSTEEEKDGKIKKAELRG
jgi:charged multivesicular body protein 3